MTFLSYLIFFLFFILSFSTQDHTSKKRKPDSIAIPKENYLVINRDRDPSILLVRLPIRIPIPDPRRPLSVELIPVHLESIEVEAQNRNVISGKTDVWKRRSESEDRLTRRILRRVHQTLDHPLETRNPI